MRIKKSNAYNDLIIYPTSILNGKFTFGLEEDITDSIDGGFGSKPIKTDIEQMVNVVIEPLDLSLRKTFSPHAEEVDTLVENIYKLFDRYEDDDTSEKVNFSDGWKWSEGGDELSPASITSVLNNTNLLLEKITDVCKYISTSINSNNNSTTIQEELVVHITNPLKDVDNKYVMGGFLTDEKGRLTLAPKKPEVAKIIPISKKDIVAMHKVYEDVDKKYKKILSLYEKCKNKFLSLKNTEEEIATEILSFILTTFADVVGSFILLKKIGSIEYSNLLMSIKKSM